jgi:hypothetical protein
MRIIATGTPEPQSPQPIQNRPLRSLAGDPTTKASEVCLQVSDRVSGNQHPRAGRRPRARLHDNLHVAAEQHEAPHDAIKRKPCEPAPHQGRHFRLVNLQKFSGGGLSETALGDERGNLARELGLRGARVPDNMLARVLSSFERHEEALAAAQKPVSLDLAIVMCSASDLAANRRVRRSAVASLR